MDEFTRCQTGSPSRDEFKRRHKDLSKNMYACDLDFVLIDKLPVPDIIAALDYKRPGDGVSFSEVIAYNALVRRGIDVYIVSGDAESGIFDISKYRGGHHRQPVYRADRVAHTSCWSEFEAWERSIRDAYFDAFRP